MKKTTVAVISASTLLAALSLFTTETSAHKKEVFSNASLRGSYALVGSGGANEAGSVGITQFDGAGGASRVLVLNEADPNSSGRLILEIPANGQYNVRPNGMGTATFLNELPDGSKVPFGFDFVITEAEQRAPKRAVLGTKLHMIQREAGIAAKLVVFDLMRLPD